MIMYTEKEVEKLLKMQKKICSDIACANWGNHVGKSVLKSPDVPLVKPCTLGSVSKCNCFRGITMSEFGEPVKCNNCNG